MTHTISFTSLGNIEVQRWSTVCKSWDCRVKVVTIGIYYSLSLHRKVKVSLVSKGRLDLNSTIKETGYLAATSMEDLLVHQ